MIIEWFILLGAQMWEGITSGLPPFDDSGVYISADRFLAPMAGGIAATSSWVPWGTLGISLGVVGIVYVASFTIKLLRAIAAHIPFIGGAG